MHESFHIHFIYTLLLDEGCLKDIGKSKKSNKQSEHNKIKFKTEPVSYWCDVQAQNRMFGKQKVFICCPKESCVSKQVKHLGKGFTN